MWNRLLIAVTRTRPSGPKLPSCWRPSWSGWVRPNRLAAPKTSPSASYPPRLTSSKRAAPKPGFLLCSFLLGHFTILIWSCILIGIESQRRGWVVSRSIAFQLESESPAQTLIQKFENWRLPFDCTIKFNRRCIAWLYKETRTNYRDLIKAKIRWNYPAGRGHVNGKRRTRFGFSVSVHFHSRVRLKDREKEQINWISDGECTIEQ